MEDIGSWIFCDMNYLCKAYINYGMNSEDLSTLYISTDREFCYYTDEGRLILYLCLQDETFL